MTAIKQVVGVVMVTHSGECARSAHRKPQMRDGRLVREERVQQCPLGAPETDAALAGGNDASQGLLEVADERACCRLVLDVPFTPEQQARRKTAYLCARALPEQGTPLEVLSSPCRAGAGHAFTVEHISSGGTVLIKRL